MTDVLATVRCPQCSALVRSGQDWCTLCHADLRPAPTPRPEVDAVQAGETTQDVAGDPARLDPLTAPIGALLPEPLVETPVPMGKHAKHAKPANVEPAAAVPRAGGSLEGVDVDAMLAELARQSADPLGGVSGQLGNRSAKVALAVGLCLGLTVVLLVGSVVLTALFG